MKIKLSLFLLTSLFINGCAKEAPPDAIPYVQVNLTLYASDPQFNNLNVTGGSVVLSGGSKGIILYRKSQEEFNAYDRHCPYRSTDPCSIVNPESITSFTASDTCCLSRFSLFDGSVQSGPSTRPLKAYRTSYDGSKVVVFN